MATRDDPHPAPYRLLATRPLRLALLPLTVALVQACAQADGASAASSARGGGSSVANRLIVTTAVEWADIAALGRAVSRSAGVPVQKLAGISPRSFAVTLDCPDAPSCEAARQRLAADATLVTDVRDDVRQRLPSPPPTHPASPAATQP